MSLVTSCFTATYVHQWPQHFPGTPLAGMPMFDARAVLYPLPQTLRDYLSWRQADTHVNNLVRPRVQVAPCPGDRALTPAADPLLPAAAPLFRVAPLQYNTCFWALVKSGKTATEAHEQLRVRRGAAAAHRVRGCTCAGPLLVAQHAPNRPTQGTLSDYKNELLFSQFGLNYNTVPERFRKVRRPPRPALLRVGHTDQCWCASWELRGFRGLFIGSLVEQNKGKYKQTYKNGCPQGSVVVRQRVKHTKTAADGQQRERERLELCVLHCDIIKDAFWAERPELLA